MIKALLFDFSRVLLFPKDESYAGSLNEKHRELSTEKGYSVLDHFVLNEKLLEYLKGLNNRYEFDIFTSETIQEASDFQPHLVIFRQVFSALKLGLSKKEASTYKKIAQLMGFATEEIVFIDDVQRNLEAASQSGMKTIHYKNNQQLLETLNALAHTT